MACCNLLTLLLAALTITLIVRIPTTPSTKELMKIQKRRQQLKLKAGTYKPYA
jgi:hypothetical protein